MPRWSSGMSLALPSATLARHTSAVTCLAFAPDGKTLATGSLDWTVKVWNLATGMVEHSLEGNREAIDALAFAPDGKTLASSSRDGTTRLWDVARGVERKTLRGRSGPGPLVFTPDGQSLIEGGADGSLLRWDPGDGHLQALERQAHLGAIVTLALSPDGKVVASGGGDHDLKLWELAVQLAPRPFASIEGKVQSLALSSDGKLLASATTSGVIQLWEAKSGRERWDPYHFGVSGDSSCVLTRQQDTGRSACRLEFRDAEALGHGKPTRTRLAGCRAGCCASTRLHSRRPLPGDGRRPSECLGTGFGTAGSHLESTNRTDSLDRCFPGRHHDRDGGRRRDCDAGESAIGRGSRLAHGAHPGSPVRRFRARRQDPGQWGGDRTVRLWDVGTRSPCATLSDPRGTVAGLAFAPDGERLAACADADPTILFWDVPSGHLTAKLTMPAPEPGEGFACLAWAPDGKTLFTGSDRGIAAWDVTATSRDLVRITAFPASHERATLRGLEGAVLSLAVLDDGKTLVSRGQNGVIKIWDLGHGHERLTLGSKTLRLRSMAICPGGHVLAAGIRNSGRQSAPAQAQKPGAPSPAAPAAKTAQKAATAPAVEAKVWNLDTGKEVASLSGHNGDVVAVQFSPDGKSLATTSRSGGSSLVHGRLQGKTCTQGTPGEALTSSCSRATAALSSQPVQRDR